MEGCGLEGCWGAAARISQASRTSSSSSSQPNREAGVGSPLQSGGLGLASLWAVGSNHSRLTDVEQQLEPSGSGALSEHADSCVFQQRRVAEQCLPRRGSNRGWGESAAEVAQASVGGEAVLGWSRSVTCRSRTESATRSSCKARGSAVHRLEIHSLSWVCRLYCRGSTSSSTSAAQVARSSAASKAPRIGEASGPSGGGASRPASSLSSRICSAEAAEAATRAIC